MLEIKNISKTYGDKKAVNNLSLHINAGDMCAIIGHNGAGKTTLIKMITGIIAPDVCSRSNLIAPNGEV
jgi:ABC-2 type transport system ATP-binding protein